MARVRLGLEAQRPGDEESMNAPKPIKLPTGQEPDKVCGSPPPTFLTSGSKTYVAAVDSLPCRKEVAPAGVIHLESQSKWHQGAQPTALVSFIARRSQSSPLLTRASGGLQVEIVHVPTAELQPVASEAAAAAALVGLPTTLGAPPAAWVATCAALHVTRQLAVHHKAALQLSLPEVRLARLCRLCHRLLDARPRRATTMPQRTLQRLGGSAS